MAGTRLLLCASTMLAGLCCPGPEPAIAGPNTPSISAPNIAPTRPDFNMRAPDALRRGDTASPRDVASSPRASKKQPPRDVAKTKPLPKRQKTFADRGAVKLASNQRASIDNLRKHLEGIERHEEFQRTKELLDALFGRGGPLAKAYAGAGGNFVPGGGRQTPDPKGAIQANFPRPVEPSSKSGSNDAGGWTPWLGSDQFPHGPRYGGSNRQRERGTVRGIGPGGAPVPAGLQDPSGQVAEGKPSRYVEGGRVHHSQRRIGEGGSVTVRETGTLKNGDIYAIEYHHEASGDTFLRMTTRRDGSTEMTYGTRPSNPPSDRAPVEEGTGRPSGGGADTLLALRGGRQIICDFFGCREGAPTRGSIGDPGRDNPDGSSTVAEPSSPSAGPGAATDPCPDCAPSGGGGTPVSRPSDVGWGGPGVPGGEGGGTPGPRGAGSTPQ